MSFPNITDILNYYLGTNIDLPFATFGAFVGIAILVSMKIVTHEVERLEKAGLFSGKSNSNFKVSGMVGDLTFIVVLTGIIGAKLFDAIEQPNNLLRDPLGVLFSTSGFSIYGGLIFGTIAGILYVRYKSISVIPMLDACAPALAIGYSIGRLGCQVSGDGDWGKQANMDAKPTWIPDWFWAQTYENNALAADIPSPGVYPTPIYEFFISLIIFLVLWAIRKRINTPGLLFSLYLIMSGFERFLIEIIRINAEYNFMNLSLTQAQIISVGLIFIGLISSIKITKLSALYKLMFVMLVMGSLTACMTIIN